MKAVQHLLNEIGYVGTKLGDKSEDLAAVAMEMTPEEVQWLKVQLNSLCTFSSALISLPLSVQGASSKSLDMHDQIKQLDGCRAVKVHIT